MGWFSRRSLTEKEVTEIATRAAIEAVREVAKSLVESRASGASQALETAISGFLGKAIEAQAGNLTAMGTFVEKMGELSIRRAAAALGSRGGQARARNVARQKGALELQFDCAVCRDPQSRDGNAILRHVNERHDARRQSIASQEAIREHNAFVNQSNGERGN